MSQNKMRKPKSEHGFKTYSEAIEAADKSFPVSRSTVQLIRNMHTAPIRTKDDFRWHILFNILEVMMREMNNDLDTAFWMRIKTNTLLSAELYLE